MKFFNTLALLVLEGTPLPYVDYEVSRNKAKGVKDPADSLQQILRPLWKIFFGRKLERKGVRKEKRRKKREEETTESRQCPTKDGAGMLLAKPAKG